MTWRAAICVLAAAATMTVSAEAQAQGFFDFLFGGPQRPAPAEPNYPPPPPALGRVAPAPLGQEHVNGSSDNTGHAVAFCVRLCDGQHFPMEQMANATPVETCRTICPYSKTKVFIGAEVGNAVAQDGQRYAALDTAFIYRKQTVANCTCNGKDSFGLLSFDVKNDPTLRPGDIVSTKDGLMAFTGKSGQTPAFAPVNPSMLPPDIKPAPAPPNPASNTAPTADNAPAATAAQPPKRPPQNAPAGSAPAPAVR